MRARYVRDVRLAKPASADLEVPEVDPRAPVRTDWAVKTQVRGAGVGGAVCLHRWAFDISMISLVWCILVRRRKSCTN